jgi:hypothetical protein
MSDIRDLIRVYGVDEDEGAELEALAMRARIKPWWRDYSEVFENEFPGFENDATQIRVCMPLVLPGLLQTQDYTEALFGAGSRPPTWQRRALECRQRRQQILERTDGSAPKLIAVIAEASLMYRWGSRNERREQILHLVELSRRSNVELHIQRFADGPYRGMWSMVNIFDFADDEPSLVYLETDIAIQEASKPEEVDNYVQGFGHARDAALEPGDTAAYLKHLAEQLE